MSESYLRSHFLIEAAGHVSSGLLSWCALLATAVVSKGGRNVAVRARSFMLSSNTQRTDWSTGRIAFRRLFFARHSNAAKTNEGNEEVSRYKRTMWMKRVVVLSSIISTSWHPARL